MATQVDSRELSGTYYATRRKEILSLVNQLRAIGAQSDLDLPRITVIGNQSAGKSSVVEAISGINVPRDAGTCTRCPMECRLSSSAGPWSCKISLRREFDPNGKRLDEVAEIPFGDVITNKADVEPALRRAQLAVLNPEMDFSDILSLSVDDLKNGPKLYGLSLPFSRNVVCVDLEGPDLTDLAFIDLPGLVQNAEPEVVKLVEDLVISHIKGNCLILVALPVTDDIENLKALRLAHEVDPEGKRTIGVMTKPDMLASGSTKALKLWLDVLEGTRHRLHHGYYCTRQPDDEERSNGVTAAESRAAEADFFSKTSPWSTTSQRQRLGTENLIARLSDLLIQVINQSLPKIRSEAQESLKACSGELDCMPKVIDMEPATYMLTLFTSLCEDIQHYVRGGSDAGHLIHLNNAAYASFKKEIRGTAPCFVPLLDSNQKNVRFVNALDEEEGFAEEIIGEMRPFYLQDMRKHITQSITRELPNNVPFQAKVALITAFQSTWEHFVNECFGQVVQFVVKVFVDHVARKFERHELLQRRVSEHVTELASKHRGSCAQFLKASLEVELTPFTQNQHYLESSTDKWLAKYKDVRAGRTKELDSPPRPAKRAKANPTASATPPTSHPPSSSRSEPIAPGLFAAPSTPHEEKAGGAVFTFKASSDPGANPFNLPPKKATPVSQVAPTTAIPNAPRASRNGPAPVDPEKINNALAMLAEIGYTGLTEDDLGKLNPSDEYETELRVMAEVRGYFQIAYKRVIDNIPALIDLKFVKAVAKELQPFLIAKFELGTPNANARCAAYLAEDPHTVVKREELIARKKRLESVQMELYKFGL